MESLQFVGCSWFIGLIGLGFRFTQNKSTSTELCALPRPFPVSSSTHLDAPGVPSIAIYFQILNPILDVFSMTFWLFQLN